ncbi:MAG: hypothetical protein IJP04_11730, partial [Clostridia bacterium]|nr:hypothetical protein [Clostridia bacterium]
GFFVAKESLPAPLQESGMDYSLAYFRETISPRSNIQINLLASAQLFTRFFFPFTGTLPIRYDHHIPEQLSCKGPGGTILWPQRMGPPEKPPFLLTWSAASA